MSSVVLPVFKVSIYVIMTLSIVKRCVYFNRFVNFGRRTELRSSVNLAFGTRGPSKKKTTYILSTSKALANVNIY